MSGPHDGREPARRQARCCPRSLTPAGPLPAERRFDALPVFHDTAEYAALVKTQSTSDLLRAPRGLHAIDTTKRMSFDAGQLDRMAR
jgi:protein-serine/threonine kinase